jgi:hypothetical protein
MSVATTSTHVANARSTSSVFCCVSGIVSACSGGTSLTSLGVPGCGDGRGDGAWPLETNAMLQDEETVMCGGFSRC